MASPKDDYSPNPKFPAGPPSVISSRMTDIASEDGDGDGGGDGTGNNSSDDQTIKRRTSAYRRSAVASESRPGTARTGGAWSRNNSIRMSVQRGSVVGARNSAISGTSPRPQSSAGRSHVPSLTSHAFFHPMSSQKLQAQRSSSRPHAASQHRASFQADDPTSPAPLDTGAHLTRQLADDDDDAHARPPQSGGTEVTEPETYDHVTADTSPSHGHYPTGSLSESTRPLQRKKAEDIGLRLNVDKTKSYNRSPTNLGSPRKSPRSFRSSFLMPGRTEGAATPRSMRGAEKLSSGASSPRLASMAADNPAAPKTTASVKDDLAKNLGRNFEYFEGNTVFCVGGRLQNTRSRPINIATGVLVVLPAALFFAFSAPYLWRHVSPAVPVVFAYLFCLCMASFLRASGSDPGILPRNVHRFPPHGEDEDPLHVAPATIEWTMIKSAESNTAAMEVPSKYCKTCNIWRPPRAHHCRVCDNCVETQDHHCVWVNNCIGRRNYRYFFTFVTTATLLALFLIGASLAQIMVYASEEQISFGGAIDHFRVPFAMVVYGAVGFLYPAALMGYHVFLMARGETTREFLNSHKFLKKDRYRAFTQGSWLKNWVVVLCRPRPPTYYRFKNRFEEGDQRLGERRAPQRAPGPRAGQEMEMQAVRPARNSFQGPSTLRSGPATPR
ncbi:hypothetical protein DL768_001735 [Monosporascus sp. mg162]|nr:hypothetical protein DL768_001735 [Monosporascus sp. mg162]